MIDEGFELQTDPANCGRCGVTCSFANATPMCSAGRCRFDVCADGHVDLDGVPQNGCECALSNSGQEICDRVDNDCDGDIDESDPRQMARLMRQMGEEAGEPLEPEMEHMLSRLEKGEDPETVMSEADAGGMNDDFGDDDF